MCIVCFIETFQGVSDIYYTRTPTHYTHTHTHTHSHTHTHTHTHTHKAQSLKQFQEPVLVSPLCRTSLFHRFHFSNTDTHKLIHHMYLLFTLNMKTKDYRCSLSNNNLTSVWCQINHLLNSEFKKKITHTDTAVSFTIALDNKLNS
jgi:hypothetical protein